MTTWFVLLVAIIASVNAAPHEGIASKRLSMAEEESLPVSSRVPIENPNEPTRTRLTRRSTETRETKESRNVLLSILGQNDRRTDTPESAESENHQTRNRIKIGKKGRKRKTVIPDYPFASSLSRYQKSISRNSDYNGNSYGGVEQKAQDTARRHQDSDIFYVRLPPTPYAYIPGLGYVSQPPTYSTAGLVPRIPNVRPIKHQTIQRRPSDSFIELPIDFVSNGKPTSVYRWQKKPNKKPVDSPITNLEFGLSSGFVSNGKPTMIHRWPGSSKPTKRPDDIANELDKGPYVFNGKPSSIYILRPDGTKTKHRQVLPPDYKNNIHRY